MDGWNVFCTSTDQVDWLHYLPFSVTIFAWRKVVINDDDDDDDDDDGSERRR